MFGFKTDPTVSQQITFMGFSGLAEWTDNRDCLNLDFWFRSGGKLKMCHSLAQHNQPELKNNQRPSQAHIDGAVEYLIQLVPRCDQWGRDADGRGYINLPESPVEPWQHNDTAVLNAALQGASFTDVIQKRFYLPKAFAHLKHSLQDCANQKLADPDVQQYLASKADEMAKFWAGKVGTLGTNGDIIADMLHAASAKPVAASDADRFYRAMKDDILAKFAEERVPFYDTDYGCGWALSELLKNANLSHLEEAMPWKTWRHFDFSDAPPLF